MARATNKGLGRGLEALLGDAAVITKETPEPNTNLEGITQINIDKIKPNSKQPRKIFDEEKINDLADSIKEHGVIQPILVRETKGGYEIVAGERRWRACRIAGIKEVPCIVRDLNDQENMLFAIIENLQREDLNPIDEAEGFQSIMEKYSMTQEQVSKSLSKSRPYITNSLRLLKLPEGIKEYIRDGQMSMGHGRALLAVEDPKKREKLVKLVIDKGISVRELERLIKEDKGEEKPAKPKPEKSPEIQLFERDLKDVFGTKVNINVKSNKGKIEIEFYSKDELERLLDLLKTV